MDKSNKSKGDQEIPIHVEDRRFWAREDRPAEEGPQGDSSRSRMPTYVEELEAGLAAARRRLEETLAAHRRSQAEFDDARVRLSRDVDARVHQAKAELFRKLLGIADDMDRALGATESGSGDAGLAEGVRRIRSQLMAVLKDEGVERYEVLGSPFDPETAEAVGIVPVEEDRHDRVVEELRPGYRLGDVTLRPAQVQVGRRQG